MGCCTCAVTGVAVVVIIIYILKKIYSYLCEIPEVPKVDENYWWAAGEAKIGEDTSIVPFKISVTDEELADLKTRLSKARPFTNSLEDVKHNYGINSELLKEIHEFWLTKYNWRERAAFLNKYPQFKTKIQGLNIHFLHIKPTETNGLKVVPLLLLHGWPGSVRDFYEVIPIFTTPSPGRNFVFEVIVPHLPGYGFSEGAARPGLDPAQIAVILKNLMTRLKFEHWYVQGGDWGASVGTSMSILYPKHILGFHFNSGIAFNALTNLKLLLGTIWPGLVVDSKHKSKLYPLGNVFKKIMSESGYFHLQATRPDTVGVALNDSPIGLAAYILEKFIAWTNLEYKSRDDGGLLLKYDYTKLLDNVMIYWVSHSITTSCRLYSEAFSTTIAQMSSIPLLVPCAFAQFVNDLTYTNETLLKYKCKNLLQANEYENGGHFAAFEEPDIFAADVWSAVEKFEIYHKK